MTDPELVRLKTELQTLTDHCRNMDLNLAAAQGAIKALEIVAFSLLVTQDNPMEALGAIRENAPSRAQQLSPNHPAGAAFRSVISAAESSILKQMEQRQAKG
jgi:hypothetical protein